MLNLNPFAVELHDFSGSIFLLSDSSSIIWAETFGLSEGLGSLPYITSHIVYIQLVDQFWAIFVIINTIAP